MPDLRDMELLAALARNMHFARAAAECGISQPAFSTRIRNLELDLGAPIVKRGNRFMGFTNEGEIALRWAHRMIADAEGLRQEIDEARGVLSGQLTIGTVPTALTFVANLAARLRQAHAALMIEVYSLSAAEIAQGLEDFSLDAGVSYLETELPAAHRVEFTFEERYELLVPQDRAAEFDGKITWSQAAEIPLCLLTRNMLNRKIIDDAFASANVRPNIVMETNAFSVALVQVGNSTAATIAPEILADNLKTTAGLARLKLVEPEIAKAMGVVISEREPMLPAVSALVALFEPD
ncbi:MAG: LysR family transcriptional regulator [Pseudomonadota bacterium]